ncbi:dual specificity phosphatase, catalytic domain-containing protein [Ditylenchus destructor]|nr:dual specificity phosphatase, catalytic domain-containing protein [Ditylenchus destructor]
MSRVGLFGQISEINDHLYLSGAGVLRPEKVRQKKISCVINATTEEPNAYLPGVDCVKIRIEDNPYARLDHYFDMVADKIRSVKDRGGRTLVHCVAGVSRSASLCIIYLVKYERMTLRQAYHYVKSARPIVRPNIGFWKQMVEYERKLRGHSSVSMIPVDNCPLPFPDVYSNDLRRHILTQPGPAHTDPSILSALQQQSNRSSVLNGTKSTVIPVDYSGKRRGLSVGTMDKARNRHSALPGTVSSGYSPWRPPNTVSFLSPAPNRRSNKQESLFDNLYNSSREAFFSAF